MTNPQSSAEVCSSYDIRISEKGQKSCNRRLKNIHNLTINVGHQQSQNPLSDFPAFSQSSAHQHQHHHQNQLPQTPKTPIQKAASLDSDPTYLSIPPSTLTASCASSVAASSASALTKSSSISSVSVPSTPKRQPPKLKQTHKMYTTANKSYGCLRQPETGGLGGGGGGVVGSGHGPGGGSNNNLYFYSSKFNRKLRSYDENISSLVETPTKGEGDGAGPLKNTLQVVAKFNPLSVSNNNLKTLPEVQMVNDFGDSKVASSAAGAAASSSGAGSTGGPTPKSKSSILHRRGSNHSLTLNIDSGSVTNLTRGLSLSNYSLGTMQGSSYNLQNSGSTVPLSIFVPPTSGQQSGVLPQAPAPTSESNAKRPPKLLQRRGSNTSLTLNIQGSQNSLNRFSSHNSLNILHHHPSEKRKNLMERRDSNRSLTLNIGKKALSISNCNLHGVTSTSLSNVPAFDAPDGAEPSHHHHQNQSTDRRFYSSENLTHFSVWSQSFNNSSHPTPYGSVDDFHNQGSQSNRQVTIKDIDIDDDCWTTDGAIEATQRNITTKPLSPQSTSEDFKIYLANIQFLQNASNILQEKQLMAMNELFQKSYASKNVVPATEEAIFLPKEKSIEDQDEEDQKKTLIKLHQEFWDLPTNYQEKPLVFGSQAKNRYKTILPNEHSRVMLDPEPGSLAKPYVNANYIKVRIFHN